jgi:hypothetical protein
MAIPCMSVTLMGKSHMSDSFPNNGVQHICIILKPNAKVCVDL